MVYKNKSGFVFILAISLAVIFFGCSEDDKLVPAENHVEAVRMQILDGANIIYDFQSADYSDQETYSNDTIKIALGKSNLLTAKFFDENGAEINPADEEHTTFEAEFGDASIAFISWNSGQEGTYQFYLTGQSEGITTVAFFIMHEGHPDFRTKVNHILVR